MKIHDFGPGIKGVVTDKEVVGGKGASLAIMTNMGIKVPPGCIIDIDHCVHYWSTACDGEEDAMAFVNDLCVRWHADHSVLLRKAYGFMPLVSVRSGAPVSMPGMMDTILNVGLTRNNLDEWCARIGERAAYDSYRRLILMLGTTAFDIPEKELNFPLEYVKHKVGIANDADLSVDHLKAIVAGMELAFKEHAGNEFPDTRHEQMFFAIKAVFQSWMSERAVTYRKINNLDKVKGTAVTIQAMAFGNLNDQSGTGVLFTRNPLTGENKLYGEFLVNAQGEDVVAGIRTPRPLHEMKSMTGTPWPMVYEDIVAICASLEKYYQDMVDIEFTVQSGNLFILQSRVGKRSAAAAIKIAMDMHQEGVINDEHIFKRITKTQYKVSKRPVVDPAFKGAPLMIGINASPGVAVGRAVFTSEQAVKARENGEDAILVTKETTPDDIAGMYAAVGIITATGGSTSHAAVVARAMDRPCVCGITGLEIKEAGGAYYATYADHQITGTPKITVCGLTGRVWVGDDVPVTSGDIKQAKRSLFDMLAGDAYQVIDLADPSSFQSVEDIPQNVCVSIEHAVMQSLTVEDVVHSIMGVQALKRNLMLDLSMGDIKQTEALRAIFGGDKIPEQWMAVINAIFQAAYKGQLEANKIIVVRPPSEAIQAAFEKYGFIINKQAKTVADLMGSNAVEITPEFIKNVMGSQEALDSLMAILEAAGKKPKGATRDIHPERLLFTRLAD